MKWMLRVLLNSAVGFLALLAFNIVGAHFGMSIGLNILSAAVIGVLGVPGFALLLVLQFLSL